MELRLSTIFRQWWKKLVIVLLVIGFIVTGWWSRDWLKQRFFEIEPQWKLLAAGILIGLLIFAYLIKMGARKTVASTSSWASYIRGQGLLLFVFLMIGLIVAVLGAYTEQFTTNVSNGIVFQYPGEDPSKGAAVKVLDSANCRHIMVLADSEAPENSTATVIVYGETPSGNAKRAKHELGRLETTPATWTRWEQPNSDTNLTIAIETGGSGSPSTKVNVTVFLSPK